jgi:tetraacyldisaccharide 4'-kinase
VPHHPLITGILAPFSWVYGLATGLRNYLYDQSLLPSYRPDIPVITVGNMIAGGTGKTPAVAWLAKELSGKYRVAVLSRGYRRKSKGFLVLDDRSTPFSAGDEPMELRMLLPGILIAVDRHRAHGIRELESGRYGQVDLVIMDDGFQHRKISPGFSVVLDDSLRPMTKEKMLPAGLRREPLSGIRRADLVIRTVRQELSDSELPEKPFLLVTGIAHPGPLVVQLSRSGRMLAHLSYPDHHRYTRRDALTIRKTFGEAIQNQGKDHPSGTPVILTTGKDFVKLSGMPELAGLPLERIPYPPPLNPGDRNELLKKIHHYVDSIKRNS